MHFSLKSIHIGLVALSAIWLIALPLTANPLETSVARDDSLTNKLGVWLWYIEGTGFTHEQLADTLVAIGVKRIYIKVADGGVNPTIWPELVDTTLVNTYRARELEVWAWSYNYPGNVDAQAQALYEAARTGYDGYTVDVEVEFNGLTTELEELFQAFSGARQQAIWDGHADLEFPIYCTTWGNPTDHDMHIDIIDQYVDAHQPQTYVEAWGPSYLENLVYWVEYGTWEYQNLGAEKPIHHIVSAEYDQITASQIDEFIATSGPQTSVWRVPGAGTPLSIWNTLAAVDWHVTFGDPTAIETVPTAWPASLLSPNYPNPFTHSTAIQFHLLHPAKVSLRVYNSAGQMIADLIDQPLATGAHTVHWNGLNQAGKPVAAGVYWYRLETDQPTRTACRRMVLLR